MLKKRYGKNKLGLCLLAMQVICIHLAVAQISGGYDPYNDPYDPYDPNAMDLNRRDTTKVKKERKPLESYFFDDSIRMRDIFVWHIDTYRNKVNMTVVDTTLTGSQPDYPFTKNGVGHAYQGNMGGASIPLNYFERAHYSDYQFAQAFDTYYFFPENANFYNVKRPYSNFSYYTAGQTRRREEGFYITHAQNISPSTGFNIDYKSRGTRGYYDWGKGRAKNLSMAVSHTGKKYSVHAGYIYNTINNKENGGVVSDRDITDTIYELPENVPVRLTDARNIIKSNTYYIVQSYGIPLRKLSEYDFTIADRSSLFFGHSLTYSRWSKVYTDTHAATIYGENETEFYNKWEINGLETKDSIFETKLSNRFFVQAQPWDRNGIVGLIDAGMGIDNHGYYQFHPNQYMTGERNRVKRTDYYLYGSVEGKFRRYLDWSGDIMFYPAGHRSGDMKVGADAAISAFIRGRPVTLSGKFSLDMRSAGYWTENLYSNHFVWSNSFKREKESRFDIALQIPQFLFEVKLSQSVLTDKIYYNSQAMPTQASGTVSVTGLYAAKEFRFGGFHLKNRVLLQWSTNEEIVPVPLVSAYISYYFEFNVVRNVLRAQIGLDGRYNTRYYAFGYMPATAVFYNQNEKKIGGYPMFDLYVSGKWKRMRILLKFEHINENLLGSRDYFTLLHYPQQKRTFKMGFSWAFYD